MLVLSDSFNVLDHDLWEHELTAGGGKGDTWDFQYYINNRTNSYVKDGTLFLQPSLTADLFTADGVTGARAALECSRIDCEFAVAYIHYYVYRLLAGTLTSISCLLERWQHMPRFHVHKRWLCIAY